MTGFDNQFRTDVQIAQNRQFYDAQRYQADQMTAQTVGQMPLQMLAAQKMDADLRLQENEIEAQHHAAKMAMMLQMDQVDRSRLENRLLEQTIEQRQEAIKRERERNQTDRDRYLLSAMGGAQGLAAQGLVMGVDGVVRRDREASANILSAGQSDSDNVTKANALRNWSDQMLDRYRFAGTLIPPKDPKDRQEYDRIMAEMNRAGKLLGVRSPGSDPGTAMEDQGYGDSQAPMPTGSFWKDTFNAAKAAGAPTTPTGPRPPEADPMVQQLGMASYQQLVQSPQWSDILADMPAEARGSIAKAMGAYAADLVNSGQVPPEMAAGYALDAVNGVGYGAAYMLKLGGYDDDRVRMILKSRGQSPESIDQTMKQIRSYIETRRKQ